MRLFVYRLRIIGDDGYLAQSLHPSRLKKFKAEVVGFYHSDDFGEEDLEVAFVLLPEVRKVCADTIRNVVSRMYPMVQRWSAIWKHSRA